MLDLDWIFDRKNAKNAISLLNDSEVDGLFGCKQIQIFVDLLWQKYYNAIYKNLFLNFMRYFLCTVIYFTFFLGDLRDRGPGWNLAQTLLVASICIDIGAFLLIELLQLVATGPRQYFSDMWNWIDIASSGLNILILAMNILKADPHA